MNDLSNVTNFYLFVSTNDEKIIYRLKALSLKLNFDLFGTSFEEGRFKGIFYQKKITEGENTFYSIEKTNDLGDYHLPSIQFDKSYRLTDEFDSLLSYSFVNKNSFVAGTDYLAIFNHYYYSQSGTFICSNNMFIVAFLAKSSLSEAAMFDTMIFRLPYKADTYFNSVKSLKAFQQLRYTLENGLELSNSIVYDELLISKLLPINSIIDNFFSRLKNPDQLQSLLTLSGGTDSTLILSILQKKGFTCHLASHKGHNEVDTQRIRKLAKKTGYPYSFIDIDKNDNFANDDKEYAFLSNGFSPSIQIYYFYKDLPGKFQIFDGYSMILGDWSDAFLNYPYRDIIRGESIDSVLSRYFSGMKDDFLRLMKEYLLDSYQDRFIDVNTDLGMKSIRQYAVEFIPGKILSRIYKCSTNFGHLNTSFYLSRNFISYVDSNKYGIASTCSARHDYPGYMLNRYPLGLIGHQINNKIYRLNLSQGLSLHDIYKNDLRVLMKKKIHTLHAKLFKEWQNKKIPRVKKINYDLSKFDQIENENELNFFALRPLSQYNSIYSVIEGFDEILKGQVKLETQILPLKKQKPENTYGY